MSCILAIATPLLQANAQYPNHLYEGIPKMETSWKGEYEAFFGTEIQASKTDVVSMSKALQQIEVITGERTAIFWLIQRADRFNIFLLTPDKPPIQRTKLVSSNEVDEVKRQLFEEITAQHRFATKSYLPPAQKLYDWIVRPVAATLESERIDNIVFCSGKGLRTLPYSALHDGEQFLVEKYGVATVPAFQLIDTTFHPLGDRPVLAMGASSFKDLPDLPGVEVELSTITPTLRRGKTFLNQDFTLKSLEAERTKQDYGIIHLATHAEFQQGTPDNSYIQFFDRRLSLDQMKNLDWQNPPVDLLVLSACRTAFGDAQAELGFAGLALQAGVRSAIASLWYVSDVGSVALMGEFYRALGNDTNGKMTKIKALREAQLALIHKKLDLPANTVAELTRSGLVRSPSTIDFSHPYYWSAYNLIGVPW